MPRKIRRATSAALGRIGGPKKSSAAVRAASKDLSYTVIRHEVITRAQQAQVGIKIWIDEPSWQRYADAYRARNASKSDQSELEQSVGDIRRMIEERIGNLDDRSFTIDRHGQIMLRNDTGEFGAATKEGVVKWKATDHRGNILKYVDDAQTYEVVGETGVEESSYEWKGRR